jgi:glycosyltransferase involved in cell wall biosynthesis
LRILYFTRSDSPHDQRFLKALVTSGHEIHALRLETHGAAPQTPEGVHEVEWQGCKGHFKLADLFYLVPRLKRILNDLKPDVVHAGPIQDVAFLVAVTGFKPLVSMSWGFDMMRDVDKNWLQRWITAYTLKHSDRLAADCQAVVEKAVTFGYPREKMIVFPWGVDLAHFSRRNGERAAREWRKDMGWEANFVVLGLRSWEPQYGMDLLAEAFVRAARQESQLRLLLLGSGSQERAIMRILREGKMFGGIHFGGRMTLDELPGYYCAADVYVSPAHVDGSSVSLLEAMACELPSIVSDIPGNCEWITNGKHGWVFKDGDVDGLVACILESCRSSRLDEMGLTARAKIEEDANWSANFPKLLNAYQSLLGGQNEK